MSIERRKSPRHAFSDQLMVKVAESSSPALPAGRTFMCTFRDISSEGIRIRIDDKVAPGTWLELWVIAKHRSGVLVMRGVVKWCTEEFVGGPYFIGVEFLNDRPSAILEWRETIATLLRDKKI